jgi:hypothetical protein
VQWEPSSSVWTDGHADRYIDSHDEAGARGGVVVKATNRQVAGSIPDCGIGIFQ